jgi:hypothetical protein
VTIVAEGSIKAVADFFRLPGETLADFSKQWKQLTETDKAQLRQGIADGSLTY